MQRKPILVVATTNSHKLQEIQHLLAGCRISIRSLQHFPAMPEVIEDKDTLRGNAIKKAETVCQALSLPVLADDSGLFVPELNHAPGVKSARYAGPKRDYAANNRKLLLELKFIAAQKRRAYFATTMAYAVPGIRTRTRTGKIWGRIAEKPRGTNGFGYDPLFQPLGREKTFAEMSLEEKNQLSHRARALQQICKVVVKDLNSLEKNHQTG